MESQVLSSLEESLFLEANLKSLVAKDIRSRSLVNFTPFLDAALGFSSLLISQLMIYYCNLLMKSFLPCALGILLLNSMIMLILSSIVQRCAGFSLCISCKDK